MVWRKCISSSSLALWLSRAGTLQLGDWRGFGGRVTFFGPSSLVLKSIELVLVFIGSSSNQKRLGSPFKNSHPSADIRFSHLGSMILLF